MTIIFYGDPHGEWRPLLEACTRHQPQAVFIVGDCELEEPLRQVLAPLFDAGVRVFYIAGNHDTDHPERYPLLFDDHPEGNLHGRAVELDGARIAGLGGVFRGRVWHPRLGDEAPVWKTRADLLEHTPKQARWRSGLPLRHRSTIFPEDLEALRGVGPVDVLVTHEAPTAHRSGFAGIDQAATACKARLVIHGHHHYAYEGELPGGCRVRGLAMAEPWVLDL